MNLKNSLSSRPGFIGFKIEIVIFLFLFKFPFFGHTSPELIVTGKQFIFSSL